uniref:AlNc14C10G1225 protein n=2 Tax=Albugo laibachii Nc14 TaxID=890382 RepID=F0W2H4_9STRA|nr:AlNc14C10G1225 [Albugo laibachii Nc14]|eukprot:CCA15260.1 AlNc14C10G1225 [Albugo laibachii Nc14]
MNRKRKQGNRLRFRSNFRYLYKEPNSSSRFMKSLLYQYLNGSPLYEVVDGMTELLHHKRDSTSPLASGKYRNTIRLLSIGVLTCKLIVVNSHRLDIFHVLRCHGDLFVGQVHVTPLCLIVLSNDRTNLGPRLPCFSSRIAVHRTRTPKHHDVGNGGFSPVNITSGEARFWLELLGLRLLGSTTILRSHLQSGSGDRVVVSLQEYPTNIINFMRVKNEAACFGVSELASLSLLDTTLGEIDSDNEFVKHF